MHRTILPNYYAWAATFLHNSWILIATPQFSHLFQESSGTDFPVLLIELNSTYIPFTLPESATVYCTGTVQRQFGLNIFGERKKALKIILLRTTRIQTHKWILLTLEQLVAWSTDKNMLTIHFSESMLWEVLMDPPDECSFPWVYPWSQGRALNDASPTSDSRMFSCHEPNPASVLQEVKYKSALREEQVKWHSCHMLIRSDEYQLPCQEDYRSCSCLVIWL